MFATGLCTFTPSDLELCVGKKNEQISWLRILVQSWSWSLDVTRSGAGKTATFISLLHSFSFDRQDTRKRLLLVSTHNRTGMGHCILFLSVILITLLAFSSGKQYRLLMTECIRLSIEHSYMYSCKRNKYRTYTLPMDRWGPTETCSKSVPVYKKYYGNTGRMLLFRFLSAKPKASLTVDWSFGLL